MAQQQQQAPMPAGVPAPMGVPAPAHAPVPESLGQQFFNDFASQLLPHLMQKMQGGQQQQQQYQGYNPFGQGGQYQQPPPGGYQQPPAPAPAPIPLPAPGQAPPQQPTGVPAATPATTPAATPGAPAAAEPVTTTNGLMAYFGNIEKVYSSDRVPVGIRREVAMRITRQAGITDIDKSRFKEGGKRGRGDMSGGDSDNKQSSGKQQQTAGGGKQPVLSTDPERIKALLGAAAASIGQQG